VTLLRQDYQKGAEDYKKWKASVSEDGRRRRRNKQLRKKGTGKAEDEPAHRSREWHAALVGELKDYMLLRGEEWENITGKKIVSNFSSASTVPLALRGGAVAAQGGQGTFVRTVRRHFIPTAFFDQVAQSSTAAYRAKHPHRQKKSRGRP
jgi:hypothetical protein